MLGDFIRALILDYCIDVIFDGFTGNFLLVDEVDVLIAPYVASDYWCIFVGKFSVDSEMMSRGYGRFHTYNPIDRKLVAITAIRWVDDRLMGGEAFHIRCAISTLVESIQRRIDLG